MQDERRHVELLEILGEIRRRVPRRVTYPNPEANVTTRDDVLLRWQTEATAVRARLAAPGVASAEEINATSGIAFLQRIFDGELP